MNQETIKAAEEWMTGKGISLNDTFNAITVMGLIEQYSSEKQQQIDELVESLMRYGADIDDLVNFVSSIKKYLPGPEFNKAQKLIQKHRP